MIDPLGIKHPIYAGDDSQKQHGKHHAAPVQVMCGKRKPEQPGHKEHDIGNNGEQEEVEEKPHAVAAYRCEDVLYVHGDEGTGDNRGQHRPEAHPCKEASEPPIEPERQIQACHAEKRKEKNYI